MMILRCLTAACITYAALSGPSLAQWSPFGEVLDVTVTNNCSMTVGEIALVVSDGIFYCPSRAKLADDQISDASHFYLVQAYGQLAIHKRSMKLADCWAAHQLAATPNGRHYVRQWIRHWQAYGTWKAGYGSPEQRIANVRSCCACGV
jgi:hypothetical protein